MSQSLAVWSVEAVIRNIPASCAAICTPTIAVSCACHVSSLVGSALSICSLKFVTITCESVTDPGFPVGGVDPLGGVDLLFGENVCENERIGSRRGVPGMPPRSASVNGIKYLLHDISDEKIALCLRCSVLGLKVLYGPAGIGSKSVVLVKSKLSQK